MYQYEVEFSGVGDPPAAMMSVGHCSQIATFKRLEKEEEEEEKEEEDEEEEDVEEGKQVYESCLLLFLDDEDERNEEKTLGTPYDLVLK